MEYVIKLFVYLVFLSQEAKKLLNINKAVWHTTFLIVQEVTKVRKMDTKSPQELISLFL